MLGFQVYETFMAFHLPVKSWTSFGISLYLAWRKMIALIKQKHKDQGQYSCTHLVLKLTQSIALIWSEIQMQLTPRSEVNSCNMAQMFGSPSRMLSIWTHSCRQSRHIDANGSTETDESQPKMESPNSSVSTTSRRNYWLKIRVKFARN